jgi:hypothetical protein
LSKISTILKSIGPERVKNIRVIVLSIAAAATFWFLNALNDNYSTTLRYPIKFNYDKERYIAVQELPKDIQINVSGLGWNLFRNSLGIKVTPLYFKLENPSEIKKIQGSSLLATLSDQLDEFQVNFILTESLSLNIDKRATRAYLLGVDSSAIQLNNEYWITSPILFFPDSVKLTGPELYLDNFIDSIIVAIPQNDIDQNYNEDIPIEFQNSRLIKRNPPTMNVKFSVEKYRKAEILVPVIFENVPEKSKVKLASENAKLSYLVTESKAETVTPDQFEITASFKKINKADSTVSILVKSHPAFLREVKLDTALFKIIYNE